MSFQLARQAKAEGLEIACDCPDEATVLLGSDGISRVRSLKKTHKVQVPSIGLGILREGESLFGNSKTVSSAQDIIHRAIGAAQEIGAAVVLVPFLNKATIESEDELERIIKNLEELAEEAEQASVVLGVESTLNVDQQKYLLEHLAVYDSVKIYYDTGNALARKSDPATFLRQLEPSNVCQMHFKDVRLGEEGAPPDFDVALGEGNVDFPTVVKAIEAMNYTGWVILETPPTANPLTAAKANLKFARSVLNQPKAS